MNNKIVLYGETHMEITNMLAERVKQTNGDEHKRAERIYLNWISFLTELKSCGHFGLTV